MACLCGQAGEEMARPADPSSHPCPGSRPAPALSRCHSQTRVSGAEMEHLCPCHKPIPRPEPSPMTSSGARVTHSALTHPLGTK